MYNLLRFRSHNHQLFSFHDKYNIQQPQRCSLRQKGKYALSYLNAKYERTQNVQLLNSVPEKRFWRNEILRNRGALNRAFFSDSSSFSCWIERSLNIFLKVFLWLYLSRNFWWNFKSFPTTDFRKKRIFPESEIIQWNHLV